MLVLTRHIDQSIMFGEPKSGETPIELIVMEIKGGQVRIGVKAPHLVEVHRKEVWDQVQAKGRRSELAHDGNQTWDVQEKGVASGAE